MTIEEGPDQDRLEWKVGKKVEEVDESGYVGCFSLVSAAEEKNGPDV